MVEKRSNRDTCDATAYDIETNRQKIHAHFHDINKNGGYKVANNDLTIPAPVPIPQSDGNCLPSLTEIHHSDHHSHKSHHHPAVKRSPFLNLPKSMIMNGCIVVIVITIVLIMSFVLFNQTSSSSSSVGIDSSVPSDYRTTSQYQRTMEYLVQNKVST